jgi:hypothetical protein
MKPCHIRATPGASARSAAATHGHSAATASPIPVPPRISLPPRLGARRGRCAPSADRAAARASVTRRGRMRPTSVRCSREVCHSRQASAVRDTRLSTSTGEPGADSMGPRTASRMAGTASCGIRAKDATGTETAPPRSMSVPASTATSPTASASASLTSTRQARRQTSAVLDSFQPGRGHAHQPGEHRPGQALALAQDLDTLASPLPGEIIEHASPHRGRSAANHPGYAPGHIRDRTRLIALAGR